MQNMFEKYFRCETTVFCKTPVFNFYKNIETKPE